MPTRRMMCCGDGGGKGATCSVKAPSACSAGHLEQLIVQQGGVAGVAAAGEGGDDRGASWHVDPRCQSLRCKHHLQQPIQ